MLMNQEDGNLIKYTFSENAILKLVEDTENSKELLYLLHFAITHLRNYQITEKVLMHIFRKDWKLITTDILKEFILGSIYQLCLNSRQFGKQFQRMLHPSIIEAPRYRSLLDHLGENAQWEKIDDKKIIEDSKNISTEDSMMVCYVI